MFWLFRIFHRAKTAPVSSSSAAEGSSFGHKTKGETQRLDQEAHRPVNTPASSYENERPQKKMSYKAKLTDFIKKGKPSGHDHEMSPPPSGISPNQPTQHRSLWKKVEQKLKQTKEESGPNLLPPATENSSVSLVKTEPSKKDVKALDPSAWLQDEQESGGDIKMKDALSHGPLHNLPSPSPNPWFSKPPSNASDHSLSYSPAQALADYHFHIQDLYSSGSSSSPKKQPNKPVGPIKSEPPAAYCSLSACKPSHDDFLALPAKKTLDADAVSIWGLENTESTTDEKDIQYSMSYLEPPSPVFAQVGDPLLDAIVKAIVPKEKHPVSQQFDAKDAASLPALSTAPPQALSAEPDFSSSTPPSEEEQHLRGFVRQMVQHRCPRCKKDGTPFETSAVFDHVEKILVSMQSQSIFKCNRARCRVYYCSGCMKTSKTATVVVQLSACATIDGKSSSSWCCPSARLFFIFLLLCGPHAHPKHDLASLLQDRQVGAKIGTLGTSGGPSASAKGYLHRVAGPAAGIGYGHSQGHDASGSGFSQVASKKNMVLLPALFAMLQEAWPSTASSSEFDQHPPELLLAMARRSPLVIKVAELLRNDCVEEVMSYAAAYQSMFDFIRVVVAHPFSAPLVRDLRTEYPLVQTLLPVCFGPDYFQQNRSASSQGRGKGKEKAVYRPPPDTLQSLGSLLSSLTDQCRAVRRYLDPGKEDAVRILEMCQRICDLSDKISRPFPVNVTEDTEMASTVPSSTPSRASIATSSVPVCPEETYERKLEDMRTWLSVNKVAEIETDDWLDGYSFCKELTKTAGSAVKSGRAKRIVYELSSLRTSLPEGIFVRHDGSRLDAMKVLIVGPEDTPYENGLFEFDLCCPLEYPNTPPLMEFKTTRSERRFNPNLYTNGKICLSLLGTWSGEPWCPKTSTLLQLLVSIQAMIFCAEPLWNEPEIESSLSAYVSDLYNSEMRADTLVFAMSDWLRKREMNATGAAAANGLWDEVVGKHFELRWRRILETAIRWEKENNTDAKLAGTGLAFLVPEKCADRRFGVGISRLKGHFAAWARTKEDMALVQIDPKGGP